MGFVIRTARALETGIRNIEKITVYIAIFLLAVMMFLGAADITGRYVFNNPVTGAGEWSRLLMGGVVFLGWAYTLAKGGHVTVDIAFGHYPPRAKAIVSFVALLLSLFTFSLITWRAAIIAMVDWQAGKLFNVILIPVAPFEFLLSFGALLLCLECIIQMVHLFPEVSGKKES